MWSFQSHFPLYLQTPNRPRIRPRPRQTWPTPSLEKGLKEDCSYTIGSIPMSVSLSFFRDSGIDLLLGLKLLFYSNTFLEPRYRMKKFRYIYSCNAKVCTHTHTRRRWLSRPPRPPKLWTLVVHSSSSKRAGTNLQVRAHSRDYNPQQQTFYTIRFGGRSPHCWKIARESLILKYYE